MNRDELIQMAAIAFAEILRTQTKGKELRIKTSAGTIVVRLVNEDEETQELTDRIRRAQDSVPETKED